jgi:RNA ligase
MFPVINTLDDLLPHIKDNPQIRVKTEDNGMTVVCYMLQDENTFAGAEEEYARECRGITFAPDGKIAARCLTKFFNIGEREDTQPHSLKWAKVVRIMTKIDGSMVTPVRIDEFGNFKFKTKKSFATKEAALADELASSPERHNWIKKMLKDGLTPTFEVTSPQFPIVLKYDTDQLTLLHIRENMSGRYLNEQEIKDLTPPFPIVENLIEQFYGDGLPAKLVSWDKLKAAAETCKGIEGWIIQFDNGDMVKLKTKWYNDLHHAVTFVRWRDIARAVCDDQVDDLKGAFALTGRSIEPILKVEHKINAKLDSVRRLVNTEVEYGVKSNFDAKAMALKFKEHRLFGLIMTQFRGKEPDYMSWYVKNHLESDWGLEVVEVSE